LLCFRLSLRSIRSIRVIRTAVALFTTATAKLKNRFCGEETKPFYPNICVIRIALAVDLSQKSKGVR